MSDLKIIMNKLRQIDLAITILQSGQEGVCRAIDRILTWIEGARLAPAIPNMTTIPSATEDLTAAEQEEIEQTKESMSEESVTIGQFSKHARRIAELESKVDDMGMWMNAHRPAGVVDAD